MSRPGSAATSGYFSPRLDVTGSRGASPMPFAVRSPSAWTMTYPTVKTPKIPGIPTVGSPAPQFEAKAVINGRIKDISLSTYLTQNEWLILVFIPMAWSFVCPTEIRAFDRRIQEFETRTTAVAFVSTDSEYVLRAWNAVTEEEGGLGSVHVPLISDRSHAISKDFGVLIEREGVAQRAMFMIDPQGTIRHAAVNDANVGRSVDEARRLLDALEFTDEFEEGCPIDWKKGDAGLKMRHSKDGEKAPAPKELAIKPKRPAHKRHNTWSGWLARGVGASSSSSNPNPTLSPQIATASPAHSSQPQQPVVPGISYGQQTSDRQTVRVPMGIVPESLHEETPTAQVPNESVMESMTASNWAALNSNSRVQAAAATAYQAAQSPQQDLQTPRSSKSNVQVSGYFDTVDPSPAHQHVQPHS